MTTLKEKELLVLEMFDNILKRIISGIVIVLITISVILSSFSLLIVFLLVIYSFMSYEWFRISKTSKIDQFLGYLIIFMAIFSLALIRLMKGGEYILLWLFVTIWCYDSFAMLGGKFVGGRKLLESVSPMKTWSGFFVGIFSSCFIVSIIDLFIRFDQVGYYFIFKYNIIFPTILFCVLAQMGDLLESYYKRKYNIKDSGNIIPGHGGMLDRYDSFILSGPILLLLMVF